MFVAALVLIGYVALTLVSLIRVRLDLQKANEALENRIEELIAAKEAADFARNSRVKRIICRWQQRGDSRESRNGRGLKRCQGRS